MRDTLSAWTTFGIGGKAKRIVVAKTRGDLIDRSVDSLLLGRGSNVLVSDDGYDGTVVVNRYESVEFSGVLAVAGSGTRLNYLCGRARERGLSGFEWAIGIPGSVGGAVRMNAGAFGSDISSVLVYADVIRNGKIVRLSTDELGFGYRRSALADGDIVVAAAFCLKPDDKRAIEKREECYTAVRRQKQPCGKSAGSVFKNPSGISVGKLLDKAGLKGTRVGGAVISERHANIIINTGGATARDVTELIAIMRGALEDNGVIAEQEIVYVGNFDR